MTSLIKFKPCLLGWISRSVVPIIYKDTGTVGHVLYNPARYAGHAKWQNIKGTKQANDLAKGRMISRYVMMVRRAIIAGNMQADPRLNTKLGDVLAEASRFNVPKATLERAIARAIDVKIVALNLDVLGPGGCSMIVRCETDNVNLLRRDVKKILRKFDSSLMPEDAYLNMFQSRGFIRTAVSTKDGRDIDQDLAEEAAIIANAQEVYQESYDDVADENLSRAWVFITDAETLSPCKGELEKQGFKVLSHDLDLVAYREIEFGPDIYGKVEELQKTLKDSDQILEVYHNVAAPKS